MKTFFSYFVLLSFLLGNTHYVNAQLNVDVKNPISFVEFFRRTSNGIEKVSSESNITYISSQTDIVIHFDVNTALGNDSSLKISIQAEILNASGNAHPIAVPGYTSVVMSESTLTSSQDSTRRINYRIRANIKGIDDISTDVLDTEIPLSRENLKKGDKVVLQIKNELDNVSYTKTFEVQDYGWKDILLGGAIWVKTFNTSKINFRTAPSASYMFYYDHEPNAGFTAKYLIPAFGLQGTIVDIDETKTVGLGIGVAWLGRSLQFGTGVLLNSNGEFRDKTYYFIGVNFLQGLEF